MTVSRASFPALAAYKGGARSLTVRIGCTERGTPCSVDRRGAHIANNIRGAEIDVNDPAAPRDLTVDASGLLRGGQVSGSDPVTVKVTDPSGIRRVEIVDVTGGAAVVGAEDYAPTGGVQTDHGAGCNFRFARAVPAAQLRRDAARDLAAGRPPQAARAGDRRRRQRRRARPLRGRGRHAVRPRRAQRRQRDRDRHDDRALHHAAAARTRRTIGYLSKADVRRPAAQRRRPADRQRDASPCSRATSTTTTPSCART